MKTFTDWGRPPRVWTLVGLGGIALLLLLFATLSYRAALTKSATYDEPLHAVAGLVRRTMGDFRINPEDPALFGYWGSLPHGSDALKINKDLKYWDLMIEDFATNQWYFVWQTLYRTPGVDGDAFVQRSRFMFVIVGVMLGALIAWWSWRLAGVWAALIAAAVFALDPNFMAHSAIVKNDVMLSFVLAALAMALWSFGQRGGWLALAGILFACAAAVNVKFSGLLAGPIIFLALLARALLPQPWLVLGMTLQTSWKRVLVVPVVCLIAGVLSVVMIWALYGFRFAPTSDPKALLNTELILERARVNTVRAGVRPDEQVAPEELQRRYDNYQPTALVETIVWATERHLLPQAWLHGFLFTYATTLIRSTYLLGEVRITGWWYYFPLAMLFKTPTATIAASAIAAVVALVGAARVVRTRRRAPADEGQPTALHILWAGVCLALPVIIYAASAMSANLNLGLRHILPVYPFLFIGIGVALAELLRRSVLFGRIVVALIMLVLAVESLRAYPNYLAFFNTPSGGWRGGFQKLGDSNLDWGQDLKLLANWQKQQPPKKMYLSYFGIADPGFHGVSATNLPYAAGGWPFDPSPGFSPNENSYLAVSATNLQGIYINNPQAQALYQQLQNYKVIDVVGGTIYIYELPLSTRDLKQAQQR
jgi:hypothetical protein